MRFMNNYLIIHLHIIIFYAIMLRILKLNLNVSIFDIVFLSAK